MDLDVFEALSIEEKINYIKQLEPIKTVVSSFINGDITVVVYLADGQILEIKIDAMDLLALDDPYDSLIDILKNNVFDDSIVSVEFIDPPAPDEICCEHDIFHDITRDRLKQSHVIIRSSSWKAFKNIIIRDCNTSTIMLTCELRSGEKLLLDFKLWSADFVNFDSTGGWEAWDAFDIEQFMISEPRVLKFSRRTREAFQDVAIQFQ